MEREYGPNEHGWVWLSAFHLSLLEVTVGSRCPRPGSSFAHFQPCNA